MQLYKEYSYNVATIAIDKSMHVKIIKICS